MDVINLAELYELAPLDWAQVQARLDAGIPQAPGGGGPNRHTCWLSTVNADGSPHVTAIGALWVDGAFWFETGRGTRKATNLARDPRCVLSVATDRFDLSVDAVAELVAEPAVVARMAAHWNDGGWPAKVDETGLALTAEYSAPSAGPPPWQVYRLAARGAIAVGTVEPGGATRWRF